MARETCTYYSWLFLLICNEDLLWNDSVSAQSLVTVQLCPTTSYLLSHGIILVLRHLDFFKCPESQAGLDGPYLQPQNSRD